MRRIFLAGCAFLFLLSASVVAQQTNSASDHFDKALAFFREQKFDAALSELNEAVRIDNRFAEAYGLRGSLRLFIRHDLDAALADFDKVIELAPNVNGIEQIYHNRGMVRMMKGNRDGALSDINKAISISPRYAEPYHTRGLLKEEWGDFDGAVEDFNKAMLLDPKSSSPYESRGIIRSYRGDLVGALDDFNKAIGLNPDHPAPYVDRASLYFDEGDFGRALQDLNKVLELYPTHASAWLTRGVINVLRGRIEEGVADLKKGFAGDPMAFEGPVKPPSTNVAMQLDNFIQSHKKDPRGYEARGIIRLLQSRKAEADTDFGSAIALDPSLKGEIETLKTRW
jgi:serine/threonine-protein kinase